MLDGAIVGIIVSVGKTAATVVSVGIVDSLTGLGETSTTTVFVTSGVDLDGLKIPIGTLHRQQSINRLAHPIANFPLNFCFANHEGNR